MTVKKPASSYDSIRRKIRPQAKTSPFIDEKLKNAGLSPVYFGVQGRPFPVYEMIDDEAGSENKAPRFVWQVYEDDSNPLTIHSELSDEEVMGTLYRNLPKPTMQHIFVRGLGLRLPTSTRRLEYVKGYPGAGKTYMAMLHAGLKTRKKPIIVDCGGRNLQDLLWETVLDFDGDRSFFEKLEQRAANGELNPLSVKALQNLLGERVFLYDPASGRAVFDWEKIPNAPTIEGRPDNHMETILDGLERVRNLEGLGDGGGNALGLKMVPGAIFRAFKEDVPLILDEYNKSKEGTDDCMQTMLQFLNGEIHEITVPSPMKNSGKGGQSFTLKRSEMGPLFFVTGTGNAVIDGVTTRALSESANQRWSPRTIPNSTYEDWLHSWTQFSMGVPVSTFYQTGFSDGRNQWDEDPASFREFLYNRLTDGLNPLHVNALPEEYFDFIDNWKEALSDFEGFARFCHKWAHMLDKSNIELKGVTVEGVLEEIDSAEYREEVGMGYRKIIEWIKEVRENLPQSKPVEQSQGYETGRYSSAHTPVRDGIEPLSLNWGSRMRAVIVRFITDTTISVGKEKTYNQLMNWAATERLVAAPLEEGKKSAKGLLGSALDISPFQGHDLDSRALILRAQLADHLREVLPERADESDAQLIPLSHIKTLLVHLQGLDDAETENDTVAHGRNDSGNDAGNNGGNDILFLNPNTRGFTRKPLLDGKTVDDTPRLENGELKNGTRASTRDLVDEESFLQTLVMPVIGKFNLKALWNRSLSTSGLVGYHKDDLSLPMAEDSHNTDLAITTVIVKDDTGQDVPVHVVKNNRTGRVLVVGNSRNERLRQNFLLARIHYISRNDPSAERKIRSALNDVTGVMNAAAKTSLRYAFLLRNQSKLGPEREENRALARLLVSDDMECFNRHYLTNKGGRLLKPRAA